MVTIPTPNKGSESGGLVTAGFNESGKLRRLIGQLERSLTMCFHCCFYDKSFPIFMSS